MSFDEEDYDLIRLVLASAKIDLQRSSEAIDLGDEKKTEKLTMHLDKIEKERIDAFIAMITELGGKIQQDDDNLNITGKVDSVKLSFIQSEKSNQEGKMISLSNRKDPCQ